jgi:hypothetical protein
MNKTERHHSDLTILVDSYLQSDQSHVLFDYITRNSNLPGPRGNLELAEAFGDVVSAVAPGSEPGLWRLCGDMAAIGVDVAPVNSPAVLICFCGTVGIGALAALSSSYLPQALSALQSLAGDERWRTREAVCFALQRMLATKARATTRALEQWVASGDPLQMRAVVAGLAHPPVLKDGDLARQAIRLHRLVCEKAVENSDRRSESFRVLRKGLAFTLSVVVAALPDEGFDLMAELVDTGDHDLIWVVGQNLKKARLTRPYPDRVRALTTRLESVSGLTAA